ncbi:MAG: hypothetical protein KGZ93_08455 [Actinobacteria bacterium]|jgi:hypothetical protein|nr:hypothetical protein [Actinomycetota bacterium]
MDGINNWLVELNKNSPIWFGVVTVLTMSGMGVIIATIIEVLFKLLGVKGERIEIHH